MKKIFLVCLMMSVAGKIFSQADTPIHNSPVKTDYLKKSKNQKTVASTLLGVGLAAGAIGLTQLNFAGGADAERTKQKNNLGVGLIVGGAILDVASIPLFIASSRNKRRALAVTGNFGVMKPHELSVGGLHRPQYSLGMTLYFYNTPYY
jgi:hypothetical protein